MRMNETMGQLNGSEYWHRRDVQVVDNEAPDD